MKYWRLVWTGLWRKKTRTLFTVLSIVVAFVLFGMLQGIDTTFKQLVDQGRLNVLVTTNPANQPLPLADLAQIRAVHGVTQVTYRSTIIGDYQSLANIVIVLPVDAASFFAVNSMIVVPPTALHRWLHARTGVLVARSLAKRLDWKVGTVIPIHALNAPERNGSSNWTFQMAGTFDIPGNPAREEPLLIMNYPYYDTARATNSGTVQMYQETIADASQAAEVADAIDNRFANSPHRTLTRTERASAQSSLAQLGDLDFFVETIVAAAFATLLLLTGSTLMQAYRERIREFAVMKTLGFTDAGIAALVLSEAVLLTTSAATIGLLMVHVLLPLAGAVVARAGLPGLRLPWIVFTAGIGFAVALALLSALPAAWRARQLSIIDALAAR